MFLSSCHCSAPWSYPWKTFPRSASSSFGLCRSDPFMKYRVDERERRQRKFNNEENKQRNACAGASFQGGCNSCEVGKFSWMKIVFPRDFPMQRAPICTRINFRIHLLKASQTLTLTLCEPSHDMEICETWKTLVCRKSWVKNSRCFSSLSLFSHTNILFSVYAEALDNHFHPPTSCMHSLFPSRELRCSSKGPTEAVHVRKSSTTSQRMSESGKVNNNFPLCNAIFFFRFFPRMPRLLSVLVRHYRTRSMNARGRRTRMCNLFSFSLFTGIVCDVSELKGGAKRVERIRVNTRRLLMSFSGAPTSTFIVCQSSEWNVEHFHLVIKNKRQQPNGLWAIIDDRLVRSNDVLTLIQLNGAAESRMKSFLFHPIHHWNAIKNRRENLNSLLHSSIFCAICDVPREETSASRARKKCLLSCMISGGDLQGVQKK